MAERVPTRVTQAAIGLALGLAVGIVVGWWLWPVMYANTSPASLRQDYRDDYVLMIAASYHMDHDLDAARAELAALDPQNPAAPVLELTEKLVTEGGSEDDITRLSELARALGAAESSLVPRGERR